jgi:hypothetical protein
MFIFSILHDERVKNNFVQFNSKLPENYNIINIEYIGRYFPVKLFKLICYRQNEKTTMINLMYNMIANLSLQEREIQTQTPTTNANNLKIKTNNEKFVDRCFFSIVNIVCSDVDLLELSNNWMFRIRIDKFVKPNHIRKFIFELIKLSYFEEPL